MPVIRSLYNRHIVCTTFGYENILRNCSRDDGCVCRYSGEEFSIILPQTDWEQSYQIAERIRKNSMARIKRAGHNIAIKYRDIGQTPTSSLSFFSFSENLTDTIREIPVSGIVIPYITSELTIVFLLCVITIN